MRDMEKDMENSKFEIRNSKDLAREALEFGLAAPVWESGFEFRIFSVFPSSTKIPKHLE